MTLPHTWPEQQRLEKEATRKLRDKMRKEWSMSVAKTGLRPTQVSHLLEINASCLCATLSSFGLSLTSGVMGARAIEAKERLRKPEAIVKDAKRAAEIKEEVKASQESIIDKMVATAAQENARLKRGGMV